MKVKGKAVTMEKNDGITVNMSSLMHLQDWDPADISNSLA